MSGMQRKPLAISFTESGPKDTYGGLEGLVFLTGQLLKPEIQRSDTLIVFMHPMGRLEYLPLPTALAMAGTAVLCAGSRYAGNDAALIMEKVVADLAAWMRHARDVLGFARIVLGGWSGGGSLSLFYQAQAEQPRITHTPAGDVFDLTTLDLPKANGVLLLAAHVSRAGTLTEWLDPSVTNELRPEQRDAAWNLYADAPPERPPYSADFLAAYRAAQIARNRRITAWAQSRLAELTTAHGSHADQSFVVHGTMADPRWLDPSVDPNERKPGWCYLGDPRLVNDGPAGLGRYATLRSWLSQWSYDLSNACGLKSAAQISVPALVIGNGADDACTPSHTLRLFDAIGHQDKTLHTIPGATHYFAGQKPQVAQAVAIIGDWLGERGLG
jgi:pimeloyl-ACP methyl ester carboxylesterase